VRAATKGRACASPGAPQFQTSSHAQKAKGNDHAPRFAGRSAVAPERCTQPARKQIRQAAMNEPANGQGGRAEVKGDASMCSLIEKRAALEWDPPMDGRLRRPVETQAETTDPPSALRRSLPTQPAGKCAVPSAKRRGSGRRGAVDQSPEKRRIIARKCRLAVEEEVARKIAECCGCSRPAAAAIRPAMQGRWC